MLNEGFYIYPLFCLSFNAFIPFVFGPNALFKIFKKFVPLFESPLGRILLPNGFGLYVAELLNALN